MKKYIDLITYLFLGSIVIGFLSLLFYLTQKNYVLLKQSNEAVIQTGKIIRKHQHLSEDFQKVFIYISTIEKNNRHEYADTYGASLWQISFDMDTLKTLVSRQERKKLDSLSKQIEVQADWMGSSKASDPQFIGERNQHIKSISTIQDFFDRQITELERASIADVKLAENSLVSLHNWIIAIIITSSVIIFATLWLIYLQFNRVKIQNKQLREIAWIQSHKVRAQVATLLGLTMVFNINDTSDPDNVKIIAGVLETSQKLDEIVREINRKAEA